jgi:hypothetical protein
LPACDTLEIGLASKEPQKIPLVMSPDEAKRLLAMARNLKVHVLLALG